MRAGSDQMREKKTRVGNLTPLLLIGASLLYFADVFLRASEKYFWFDELLTVYLYRLPLHSLWQALQAGFDFNPPLLYLLTKASSGLLGDGLIATPAP